MSSTRSIKEGKIVQGIDEQIPYTLTTTTWGASPTSVSVVAKDVTNGYADVSSTILTGTSSVSGDVITLPVIKSLVIDHTYRIEVKFTCATTVFECYFEIVAEL